MTNGEEKGDISNQISTAKQEKSIKIPNAVDSTQTADK